MKAIFYISALSAFLSYQGVTEAINLSPEPFQGSADQALAQIESFDHLPLDELSQLDADTDADVWVDIDSEVETKSAAELKEMTMKALMLHFNNF